MRAMFGLVGILVTLGVIVWLLAAPGGELDQISQAKKVQDRTKLMVNDLSGLESDGQQTKADPLTLEASPGDFRYVTLTAIDPAGSELASKYGLSVGDQITAIGPLAVGGPSVSNVDDAKLQLNSMQAVASITVRRNGQQIVLDPDRPQPATPPMSAPPVSSPPVASGQAPAALPDTPGRHPAAPTTPAPEYRPPDRSNPNNPIGSKQLQGILNAGGKAGQE